MRNEITKDLGKLKTYEKELLQRLGDTIIQKWYFVTPTVNHNNILKHAVTKASEVVCWKLPFISDHFSVEIHDADFYHQEIRQIRTLQGHKISVGEYEPLHQISEHLQEDNTLLENISRKNRARSEDLRNDADKLNRLNLTIIGRLTTGESLLRKVFEDYPQQYLLISRVINQYEDEVEEASLTWTGSANELIEMVKVQLEQRLHSEGILLSGPDVHAIVNHTVARWLALCPLDIN